MAQTRTYKLHLPKEAATDLSRVVNDLPEDEYRDLQAAPRRHSPTEEYIFREYVMSRRNLAEEVAGTTDVEVTTSGDIVPK